MAQQNIIEQTTQTTPARLAPQPAEIIDRTTIINFIFNGKNYSAYPGDTIASALAAAGVRVFSRSFKYHRKRGLLCCSGHCPNCLVQIGDEMNVRACTEPVQDGLVVEPQNAWPSLDHDVMSLTALGDRFLPVGFYYKSFIRPKALWPVYEHVLRHAAGLGEVQPDSVWDAYDKQYLHAGVVVVGGGPAGLSAAVAAAEQGARVLLFDENRHLGGHTRYTSDPDCRQQIAALLSSIAAFDNLIIYTDTTVLGWWDDNWLAAVRGNRLYKIRAETVVFATGAYEQPRLFDDNDLPGVMLGSGVQRLLHLYGVAPGRSALVITANDEGWQVAADLQAAGVEVVAVADERPQRAMPLVSQVTAAGAAAYWNHTILAALGKGNVEGAAIAPLDAHGRVQAEAKTRLSCDLVALNVGWTPASGLLYQAGVKLAYNEQRSEFLPVSVPEGIFVAGRVAGTYTVSTQLCEGRLAGRQAAVFVGRGAQTNTAEEQEIAARKGAEPRRTSNLVTVPGQKKRFLCFCEDVTEKDLHASIAEGYESIELLKRYSTISMGPCQGKMCSQNTIHLCAQANNWTVAETGTTTARPPMIPVKLGVLAGQNMEPVRLTPVHDWHVERGAKMMVAGLWLRPEHYGEPKNEVRAVRERVGLIDVSTLGKLRFTGPGVPDLLNRIYTNKWQKLAVGRVRYGLMCNDEGVILDDGVTARLAEDEWYTTTTSSGASAIYEWIQWWMQSGWGDGVHLTNVAEQYAAFNLAGPQSRAVLQELTPDNISNENFPYLHVCDLEIAGVPCQVMRIGFTGELSYEIHCPAAYGLHVWQALMAAGARFDILPFGVEAQRVLRLEKAHIIVGQDTDAMSDPFAAGMAWVVKQGKDTFLGQRSLARIAVDGPPQRLVGFKMADRATVPDEGLQIVQPNPAAPVGLEIIGWVTSSRFSPTLGEAIGLCWLPADIAANEGTPFNIRINGRLVEACVHHGPFFDRDGRRLRI